jgi:hypothetical protein
MLIRLVFLVSLFVSFSARAAETCEWLPVGQVGKALPSYAPWRTIGGGKVGSCQFQGSAGGAPVLFGLNQVVQASDADAVDLVLGMRRGLNPEQDVSEEPALGDSGFRYSARGSGRQSRGSLFLVGHHGRVVVIGSLTVPGEVTADIRRRTIELARHGFALASDENGMAAATRCPYFDHALLERLFAGAEFAERVYGSNSCIAHAGERVLILAISGNANAETARSLEASGHCMVESLSDLGDQGSLGHTCKEGNARAIVGFLQGSRHFQFDWVPGREPTESERDLLVELAQRAYERADDGVR